MGKKRSKKSLTTCNPSDVSELSISDSSFSQDNLFSDNHAVVLKVLLSRNTEDADEYKKWTKSCYWKNIAFIRPSVLRDYDCNTFLLIRGKSNCAIFMAKPLKSVKNGNVVLLNGMGFDNEEIVTLSHFKEVYEAQEIFFDVESSLPYNFLQEMLEKKLSNRFIWCGLKLQFTLFDVTSECVVSKAFSDTNSKSNCLGDVSDSSKHISHLFSSLTLQDSINDSSHSEDTQSFTCFITNHRSSIVVSEPSEREPELPYPSIKHIGGYRQHIEIIRNYINTFLRTVKDEVQGCTSMLLLSGPSKTGKKMTINAIIDEYGIPTMKINMSSMICQNTFANLEEEIKLAVKNASKNSQSFLMLDKFDLFCCLKSEEHVSKLFSRLNEICGDQVLIITTLSSEFAFDKQLLNSSFSVQEVKFMLPCICDREEIIEKILVKQKQELSSTEIKHCAELLQGLSGGYIHKILKYDAPLLSLIRTKNALQITPPVSDLSFSDIETAIKKRKTSLLSSDMKANKVKWTDIGGMETIKKELIEELELMTQTPKEKLKRFNYIPSQGILLYGPPGCSKTMIARALATECNWNFISKKASDIMNMYVGESEKAVTNLFLEAKVKAPCIIFLDEIDAIAPARNSSSAASGVQNRVVNCLLTEMAGIETLKDVLIIAATNRPDIIDDALLRRGRIGKLIYVPLPDNKTRGELFRLCMKKRKVSVDVNFDDLIKKTEGYTGAEIVQLCNEAAMQILIEDPDCLSPIFKGEHFKRALLTVPPLTHKETIHFYEQFGLRNSKEKGAS